MTTLKINGCEFVSDKDWTVKKIRFFYDRHEKMWCIDLLTEDDDMVECIRTIKSDLNDDIKRIAEEYGINDIQKY